MTPPSPAGSTLPPEVRDASAWYGSELATRSNWIERLSEAEIAEVDHVVHEI
jgi:hypothetical protein